MKKLSSSQELGPSIAKEIASSISQNQQHHHDFHFLESHPQVPPFLFYNTFDDAVHQLRFLLRKSLQFRNLETALEVNKLLLKASVHHLGPFGRTYSSFPWKPDAIWKTCVEVKHHDYALKVGKTVFESSGASEFAQHTYRKRKCVEGIKQLTNDANNNPWKRKRLSQQNDKGLDLEEGNDSCSRFGNSHFSSQSPTDLNILENNFHEPDGSTSAELIEKLKAHTSLNICEFLASLIDLKKIGKHHVLTEDLAIEYILHQVRAGRIEEAFTRASNFVSNVPLNESSILNGYTGMIASYLFYLRPKRGIQSIEYKNGVEYLERSLSIQPHGLFLKEYTTLQEFVGNYDKINYWIIKCSFQTSDITVCKMLIDILVKPRLNQELTQKDPSAFSDLPSNIALAKSHENSNSELTAIAVKSAMKILRFDPKDTIAFIYLYTHYTAILSQDICSMHNDIDSKNNWNSNQQHPLDPTWAALIKLILFQTEVNFNSPLLWQKLVAHLSFKTTDDIEKLKYDPEIQNAVSTWKFNLFQSKVSVNRSLNQKSIQCLLHAQLRAAEMLIIDQRIVDDLFSKYKKLRNVS